MKQFLLKQHTSITCSLILAAGALFNPMVSQAQATEADSDDKDQPILEEVVVTATRREENLQLVPIAVSAITGDELAFRGAQNIADLAETIPSLTLEPTRATNSTLTAFIRGVGQQDPLAGFEPGVALYLDDVYLARPQGALLDIYDVERIEVLRGPQGTLYGRNAVGGAIKYVTRRLSDEPSMRLRGVVGSYDQLDLIATGSVPLGETFKIGGSVASFNRDGYGDNLTTGEENYNKDVFAYRVSAEWAPTENFLVRFGYDSTEDDSDPVAGYRLFPGKISGDPVLNDIYDTTAGASQLPSTAGINGNNELEADGLHLTMDWTLNDEWTLRSITANREDYTESVIDFDSLESMDFDAQVVYDNEQFSQELQVLYDGDRLHMVAGLYYLDASAANDFDVVLGLLHPLGITAYTGGTVDTKATSLFVDLTYDFNDSFALSLGGRYTSDKRSADIFRGTYLGIGSPFFGNDSAILIATGSDYEASKTFNDFSPRIVLNYKYTDDMMFYGGYTQGYKAGSFDPRGSNFVTPEAENGFDPETVDSYEMGMKSLWLDGRARTNIALFYSDYRDMQIPGSVGVDANGDGINDGFVGAVTNAGKAVIKGIEFEGSYAITSQFIASAAFSLLDADMKEFIVNGVNVADQRAVQNTPEEMFNVNLTYDMDFLNGSLRWGLNWSYRGDTVQFETPAPVIDQEAYSIFNANVTWVSEDDRWLVGIYGRNLADEDIKTAGYCFGTGCPFALGLENNTTVFYAPPRTFSVAVEYRF